MKRLPTPGSDNGTGEISSMNFLLLPHASDGTLKDSAITTSNIAPGAITLNEIADLTITNADVSAISESKITNLITDLASKAFTSRAITAGTGLTGGGDLTADRWCRPKRHRYYNHIFLNYILVRLQQKVWCEPYFLVCWHRIKTTVILHA